jgi:uncharacterized protein YjgD (DUF1641 family)
MAKPIRVEIPPHDGRAQLASRVGSAPTEHAEAVLAAYEVLQGLHDRGVLDLMRGTLGASDALVEVAVSAAATPESIRALRNLLLLANALGAIEPALLADFTRAVPDALVQASAEKARPPGLLKLLRTFFNRDFRRGLAAANDLLVAFGRNLSARDAAAHAVDDAGHGRGLDGGHP